MQNTLTPSQSSRQVPHVQAVTSTLFITSEGIFDRTVAAPYPTFKFSFTIWILNKAGDYWEQLKDGGRD